MPENATPSSEIGSEAEFVHLSQADVTNVEAEEVQIRQGSAGQIIADEVEMSQSAANAIRSHSVEMRFSGALAVRSDLVETHTSALGAAQAASIRMSRSRAGVAVADQALFENSSTVFLLARDVHGPVNTVFDSRGSLLAGMTAGIALGLVLFVTKLLGRR